MAAGLDMSKCKSAVFSKSTILCKAGLNERPLPIITKKATVGPTVVTFVKCTVSEPWLCKAVTGVTTAAHTSIGRTTLLDELLTVVKQACDGEIPTDDAEVTAEGPEDEDEDDPMNEVEVDTGAAETPQPKKRKRGKSSTPPKYTRSVAKNKVLTVDRREVAEEADPNNEALRKILLLIQDRRSVWIPIEDVDWLVKYMFAQNRLKGVKHVTADSTGPN